LDLPGRQLEPQYDRVNYAEFMRMSPVIHRSYHQLGEGMSLY